MLDLLVATLAAYILVCVIAPAKSDDFVVAALIFYLGLLAHNKGLL